MLSDSHHCVAYLNPTSPRASHYHVVSISPATFLVTAGAAPVKPRADSTPSASITYEYVFTAAPPFLPTSVPRTPPPCLRCRSRPPTFTIAPLPPPLISLPACACSKFSRVIFVPTKSIQDQVGHGTLHLYLSLCSNVHNALPLRTVIEINVGHVHAIDEPEAYNAGPYYYLPALYG